MLAGVSTEWYTRLERGHIRGVSEDVLRAVARALQLDSDERTYLLELARSARKPNLTASRHRDSPVPPEVQWLLDSMTTSSAFVRNRRTDAVAANALARALYAPMFDSASTDPHGHPNIARYIFLDPSARDFFVDWEAAASATASLLRAEAGHEPRDEALRELVSELSAHSRAFRDRWSDHDVLLRHTGSKGLQHPEVGQLDLTFVSLDLPVAGRGGHQLVVYTAEPHSPSENRLKALAQRGCKSPQGTPPTRSTRHPQTL